MEIISCPNNYITQLDNLPKGVYELHCDNNPFKYNFAVSLYTLKKYLETINFPLAKIQLYVNPLPISIYINEKIGSKTVTTPLITEKIKNSLIQKNIKLIETDQAKYKIYFDFDTKESDQLVGNRISCSLNYTIKVYNASSEQPIIGLNSPSFKGFDSGSSYNAALDAYKKISVDIEKNIIMPLLKVLVNGNSK